ncbi:hypothetical protein ACFV4N_06375 [Actinosynnema sp. NPDC059797]
MIRAGLLPALLVAACALSCSSADEAVEYAAQEARDNAERGRQHVEAAVRAKRHEGAGAALTEAVVLDPDAVFAERVVDGGFEVDAAYYGSGTAGGGWSAETSRVRVCVRFAARVEPPTVEARAVDCPGSLPTVVPGFGTFDRTVPLTD